MNIDEAAERFLHYIAVLDPECNQDVHVKINHVYKMLSDFPVQASCPNGHNVIKKLSKFISWDYSGSFSFSFIPQLILFLDYRLIILIVIHRDYYILFQFLSTCNRPCVICKFALVLLACFIELVLTGSYPETFQDVLSFISVITKLELFLITVT